jgi:hypothetical protein
MAIGIRHQESNILSPDAVRRYATVTPVESRQAAGPAWVEASEDPIVFDLSHFGLLAVKGEDTLRFLHNQVSVAAQAAQRSTRTATYGAHGVKITIADPDRAVHCCECFS